jgi:regulator of replication initiation timing
MDDELFRAGVRWLADMDRALTRLQEQQVMDKAELAAKLDALEVTVNAEVAEGAAVKTENAAVKAENTALQSTVAEQLAAILELQRALQEQSAGQDLTDLADRVAALGAKIQGIV